MSNLLINKAILDKIDDLRPHLIYDVSIPKESTRNRLNEVNEILDDIVKLNSDKETYHKFRFDDGKFAEQYKNLD